MGLDTHSPGWVIKEIHTSDWSRLQAFPTGKRPWITWYCDILFGRRRGLAVQAVWSGLAVMGCRGCCSTAMCVLQGSDGTLVSVLVGRCTLCQYAQCWYGWYGTDLAKCKLIWVLMSCWFGHIILWKNYSTVILAACTLHLPSFFCRQTVLLRVKTPFLIVRRFAYMHGTSL